MSNVIAKGLSPSLSEAEKQEIRDLLTINKTVTLAPGTNLDAVITHNSYDVSNASSKPANSSTWGYLEVTAHSLNAANYVKQVWTDLDSSNPRRFLRVLVFGVFTDWRELLTSANFTEYAAAANHNHDTVYSQLSHNHDTAYSQLSHDHDTSYSQLSHNHDTEYSQLDHNHDTVYAVVNHGHNYSANFAALEHYHDDRYVRTFDVMWNGVGSSVFGVYTADGATVYHRQEISGSAIKASGYWGDTYKSTFSNFYVPDPGGAMFGTYAVRGSVLGPPANSTQNATTLFVRLA